MIYFILTGAIAGWLSGQIMKGASFGLFGNIIIGIIGGIIGGWIFKFLGIRVDNDLVGSIITSVAGAVILLWAVNQAESGSRRR